MLSDVHLEEPVWAFLLTILCIGRVLHITIENHNLGIQLSEHRESLSECFSGCDLVLTLRIWRFREFVREVRDNLGRRKRNGFGAPPRGYGFQLPFKRRDRLRGIVFAEWLAVIIFLSFRSGNSFAFDCLCKDNRRAVCRAGIFVSVEQL